MDYFGWNPYVRVAARRQQATHRLAKLRKKGHQVSPVVIDGRKIATTFWGEAWCENLERYSDYSNRLPRGRTYVRNGSVIDLQVAAGTVTALVSGSDIYDVRVDVAGVPKAGWRAICRDCTGAIDSVIELLQGGCRRASWLASASQRRGCSPRRRRSRSGAAARTGRGCASTSPRCCTGSARGSTNGRSCCSCSDAWTIRISLRRPTTACGG